MIVNDTGLRFTGTEELRAELLALALDRVEFATRTIASAPALAAAQLQTAMEEFKRLLGKEPATT